MSLNLTLQTTLDYDSEFQSLMNTMIMVSNFVKQQKNNQLMREAREIKMDQATEVTYYRNITKEVQEAIGFLPNASESEVGFIMLDTWGRHSFINTNANILDKRFERTKLFLKVAPIKVEIENKYDVIFSKGDKQYLLNFENLPTINRLLRSSQSVREEFPPAIKKTTTIDDIANYDARIPAYTAFTLEMMKEEANKAILKKLKEINALDKKIKVSSEVITQSKLRAGYVLMRQLGRN